MGGTRLRQDPLVEYAELNSLGSFASTIPGDIYNPQQWNLDKIQAFDAWDLSTGSSNLLLAVIDTGMLSTHEDLSSRMWTNTLEVNGQVSVDDDNNGYVDDKFGWDFGSNDNDPNGFNSHGNRRRWLRSIQWPRVPLSRALFQTAHHRGELAPRKQGERGSDARGPQHNPVDDRFQSEMWNHLLLQDEGLRRVGEWSLVEPS